MIYFLFVIFIVIASLLSKNLRAADLPLTSLHQTPSWVFARLPTSSRRQHGVSPLLWYSSASYALMLLRFLLPKAALWRRQLLKHRTQTRTQLLVSAQASSSKLRLLVLSRLQQQALSRLLLSPQSNTNKTVL